MEKGNSMSDLISRKDLWATVYGSRCPGMLCGEDYVKWLTECINTAESVNIVTCGNCVYSDSGTESHCSLRCIPHNMPVTDKDFCSHGKAIEEDTKEKEEEEENKK